VLQTIRMKSSFTDQSVQATCRFEGKANKNIQFAILVSFYSFFIWSVALVRLLDKISPLEAWCCMRAASKC